MRVFSPRRRHLLFSLPPPLKTPKTNQPITYHHTVTPPPGRGGATIARVVNNDSLPQAEVESALEDVNAAAARLGYTNNSNNEEEEDEEEQGGGGGGVFSAAAADAITSRLRDLDDGCVNG